jgi:phosphate transport system protein
VSQVRDRYHQQLDALREHVLQMADLARQMLSNGVTSFLSLEVGAAKQVLEQNKPLSKFDDEIEQEALLLVARQQPMARDLRHINRIGRYGRDIAEVVEGWKGSHDKAFEEPLRHMTRLTLSMLDLVLDAYKADQPFQRERLQEWEDRLDKARWDLFRQAVALMTARREAVEMGAHYMMAARYLERTGDNICKMGEKIHYAITGNRIEIH